MQLQLGFSNKVLTMYYNTDIIYTIDKEQICTVTVKPVYDDLSCREPSDDSGLCRQVVIIKKHVHRVSLSKVAHGAADSGLYRQVIFLYKWSL